MTFLTRALYPYTLLRHISVLLICLTGTDDFPHEGFVSLHTVEAYVLMCSWVLMIFLTVTSKLEYLISVKNVQTNSHTPPQARNYAKL